MFFHIVPRAGFPVPVNVFTSLNFLGNYFVGKYRRGKNGGLGRKAIPYAVGWDVIFKIKTSIRMYLFMGE